AVVSDMRDVIEIEPNNSPATAMKLAVPSAVNGRIAATVADQTDDEDFFRFDAKAGEQWIIETQAAQRGSPIDTKIEVLQGDGKPVPRLQLQAVRNSAVTFRGIDSTATDVRVDNWEEMELNQFFYLQGEVAKLFRAPQGPDSGFQFYSLNGKRRNYFDTSATAHANEEPCYIVEPHPVGAKLVANGLPVFPLYFANDDDAERKLGSDSKIHFTAPADGSYLVRVTDNRGHSGERFVYRLIVRAPKLDFKVTLDGANPTVPSGSGQSFTLKAERFDDFEGEIKIDITGLPPGFVASTPLVIEAGHTSAAGTLHAALNAPVPTETNWSKSEVIASAEINGQRVFKNAANFGTIKLGDQPKLFVALEPSALASTNLAAAAKPLELTIAPGQTIPAWIKVRRNGHDDLVTFSVDNLPHGVIVDNIGLNGVLMPKGENERQIFLAAAKWVPETDRLCFAIENQAGRQTSLPVMLHVRKAMPAQSASAK
ncbi:MAG: hypothetical protein HY043_16285, partial [Verrucomicrobia bacterium]|nr:hypothetical protein [Verrucomicrobiota bacterium]